MNLQRLKYYTRVSPPPMMLDNEDKPVASEPRLLLIDDDADFCAVLSAVAVACGNQITWRESLQELGSLARMNEFDLILLDYQLAGMNGLEMGEYIDVFFRDLPVVLTSANDLADVSLTRWPKCIKRFVPKSHGPIAILNAVKDIVKA